MWLMADCNIVISQLVDFSRNLRPTDNDCDGLTDEEAVDAAVEVRADDASGVERTYALLLLPGRTSGWGSLLAREGVSSSVHIEDCPVHFIPCAPAERRSFSQNPPAPCGHVQKAELPAPP